MKLKPRTKIFVRPDPKTTKVGSILLAEEAQSTVETGTVVYGLEDLKEGDRVVYDKALSIPFRDLLVFDPDDIWAIEIKETN
jgi:co-chaperonin GroES (HSP10)